MIHRAACLFVVAVAALSVTPPVQGQTLLLNQEDSQDEFLGYYLPAISIAADGSFGIAAEALFRTSTGREVLRVAAQRYAPSGAAVGPTHVFSGESCSGLDLWLTDYMERPSVDFHPDGTMLVLMQHTGEFQIGSDGVQSAEITMGGIGTDGQVLDLAPQYSSCVQAKLIFVGGGRQDRPRFDLTPAGDFFITADGFFQDADLRNAAIRVLDAGGNEVIEEAIPHTDQLSQQSFHMYPDIATNGSIMLSAWHRCPVIDNQGNAAECDIEVQFATISQGGLQTLGGNQRVNAGDPVGTINMYPAVAMNAAGQSIVAWADARDSAQGDVYAQRFDAGGNALGGNFKVSAGQGAIDSRPEVAILDNGRVMIVWTDSSAVGYRARARTFDAAGNPEGPPIELAPGKVSGDPSVTADGSQFAHIFISLEGETTVIGSNKPMGSTATENPIHPPHDFVLDAPYPNPFIDATHIAYRLAAPAHVSIRVYDLLGREVERLIDSPQTPGPHSVTLEASGLGAGLYVVEMRVGEARQVFSVVRQP